MALVLGTRVVKIVGNRMVSLTNWMQLICARYLRLSLKPVPIRHYVSLFYLSTVKVAEDPTITSVSDGMEEHGSSGETNGEF